MKRVIRHDCELNRQRVLALAHSQSRRYSFIGGHFPFKPDDWSESGFRFITFLRNPIDRIISRFYHVMRKQTSLKNSHVQTVDINRWLDTINDNIQVRQLTGNMSSATCRKEHLEAAKKCISSRNMKLGILERFDESVMYFRNRFRWPFPFYSKKNIGTNRPIEMLNEPIFRIIEERNSYDIELYQFAEILFQRQIDGLNQIHFSRELSRFRMYRRFWEKCRFPVLESCAVRLTGRR